MARVQSIVRFGVRRRDPAHGESGEWKLGRLRRQGQNTKVLFREGIESVIEEIGRLTLVRPVDAQHRDPDRHRLLRRVILIVSVARTVVIRRRHEVVVSCQVVLTSERSRLLDVDGFHRHHADEGHLASFSFLSLRDQHALLTGVIERPRYERRERVFVSHPPGSTIGG